MVLSFQEIKVVVVVVGRRRRHRWDRGRRTHLCCHRQGARGTCLETRAPCARGQPQGALLVPVGTLGRGRRERRAEEALR